LIGLAVFAGLTVIDRVRVATDASDLVRFSHLAPSISLVVHHLQRERGASAGFLGNPDGPFKDRLVQHKVDSDASIAAFRAMLDALDDDLVEPSLRQSLDEAIQTLHMLEPMRRRVVSQTVAVKGMATYYTGAIAELLEIVEQMALLSPDADTSRRITAYTAFLQAKERAGLERAMGSNGFSAGAFAPAVHRRFLTLIGEQMAYSATFNHFATPEERAALRRVLDDEASREVDRLRDIAAASVAEGTTGGIAGPAWFDIITRKIDGLKEVEDRIAANLLRATEDIGRAAWREVWVTLAFALVLTAVTVAVVLAISAGITRPLRAVTETMGRLAKKDYAAEIPARDHRDEIGDMAKALLVFRNSMARADELAVQQADEAREREDRAWRMEEGLDRAFDQGVREILETVAETTIRLRTAAESMSSIAEETHSQASTVAEASGQASSNVQTVATAAEHLSTSIGEIGRQVQQSNSIARMAADEAERTNQVVSGLADAAQKIGEVVGLITDIADQTNLLALNATIEAARAGDAGKGFAVVANEVKSLASQTAKATEEIGQQIGAVQTETQTAVTAIETIADIIGSINEVTSAIASAVEQQNTATQEIAHNVQQARAGTSAVSQTISGVTDAARAAGAAASSVLQASNTLGEQSGELRTLVQRFLQDVRAVRSSR